jgi:hypothetical protein
MMSREPETRALGDLAAGPRGRRKNPHLMDSEPEEVWESSALNVSGALRCRRMDAAPRWIAPHSRGELDGLRPIPAALPCKGPL